jgi:hypothetical protein
MTQAGSQPKTIMTQLDQANPSTYVSNRDIRNERIAIRSAYLGERTPIEALLDDLNSAEWVYNVKTDPENHVQCLFFAHRKQVELVLANPDVLLMDCTYRTNKFKLPLLHILGCTPVRTFFSAGFCFMRTETYEDYYWALASFLDRIGAQHPRVFISDHEKALKNAASELLHGVPQLLCVWHINKNVLTKAMLVWRDANARTPEEKVKIKEMRKEFMSRWEQVCSIHEEQQSTNVPGCLCQIGDGFYLEVEQAND